MLPSLQGRPALPESASASSDAGANVVDVVITDPRPGATLSEEPPVSSVEGGTSPLAASAVDLTNAASHAVLFFACRGNPGTGVGQWNQADFELDPDSGATTAFQRENVLTPGTVASATLRIRYEYGDEFFREEPPEVLMPFIPSHHFTSRIRTINAILAKSKCLRHFGPLMRILLLLAILSIEIVLLVILSPFSAFAVWCAIILAVVGSVAAIMWTYAPTRTERRIKRALVKFNEQDRPGLGLEWRSVRQKRVPLFSCSLRDADTLLEWKIVCRVKVKRRVDDLDGEFLPAYSAGGDENNFGLLDLEARGGVEMARAPTYRSTL
ncbi:hypothetical protein BC830DRAFT_1093335 [Chytriomyces sp. MP71]|nr:hypothetical protein BC830DRAFT_1093335 [Chytriomyces sp. MP71]